MIGIYEDVSKTLIPFDFDFTRFLVRIVEYGVKRILIGI